MRSAKYKVTILLAIISCIISSANIDAQGTSDIIFIQNMPQNFQLLARDVNSTVANIELEGEITASGVSAIEVKVFQEGQLINSFFPNAALGGINSSFTIPVEIEAVRKDHTIEIIVTTNGNSAVELVAEHIVAGDVYIINGQSNAEAGVIMDDQDKDPMLRGFDSSGKWTDLKFAKPGKWGGRLAKRLVDETNIPIAIFNRAVGGKKIEFFKPDYTAEIPNNFNRLIEELNSAGIGKNVRAAIWFQGEADGWEATVESYKSDFNTLNNAWKQNLNIEQTYIFQIRSRSCSHPKPFVLEAQRQSALEDEYIQTMSTANAVHDSCHFEYEDGYQNLGDRIFGLIANDLYGKNFSHVEAPMISKIELVNSNELVLTFQPADVELSLIGNPLYDFSIKDASTNITSISPAGNKLKITTSESIEIGDKLSYLCHPGAVKDYIVNQNSVGILSFSEVTINSLITGINTISDVSSDFSVYPNPTRGSFRIQLEKTDFDPLSVDFYDLRGNKMHTITSFAPNSQFNLIDLNFPPGMYFLEIHDKNQSLGISRLIVL